MRGPRYISRAIEDGVEPGGTVYGHYGDTKSMAEVADDYTTLTVSAFDAKYPGWANNHTFMEELRQEFARRSESGPVGEARQ